MALLMPGLRCSLRFLAPLFVFAALLGLCGAERAAADSGGAREYEIKAAFLYNFVQFVRWPGAAFPDSRAPFCIGVLGNDPFGSALDDTLRGQSINGHRLMVVRGRNPEDLKQCQVVFVCRSEADHAAEIISEFSGRPVLTVSDVNGFATMGGDIDFYLANDKVRFEINAQSARHHGLEISSQLLELGKMVSR